MQTSTFGCDGQSGAHVHLSDSNLYRAEDRRGNNAVGRDPILLAGADFEIALLVPVTGCRMISPRNTRPSTMLSTSVFNLRSLSTKDILFQKVLSVCLKFEAF